MDLVLNFLDHHLLTPHVYPEAWSADSLSRQTLSLYFIALIGGFLLYFIFGLLSFLFLFDKRLMQHPKFLPNQIRKEICLASRSIPLMTLFTLPIFVLEVRGYSQLYDSVEEYGTFYLVTSLFMFLFFNDMLIYWIHRWLHHPKIYKYVHKDHHRWLIPTPFASHAFHPLDGFAQSTPYHIFVFLFPLHKVTYIVLFVLVNFWTISIHDGNYQIPQYVSGVVNCSAHHTDHHLYYNYNYGQYFTLWDRIGGSYRVPSALQGRGPYVDLKLQ